MDKIQNYDPIVNPYFTTRGKLIPIANLEVKLQNLVIGFKKLDQSDLSYGINFKKLIPVIILGKDSTEKDIPILPLPYIFSDVRGKEYVAIDLREYVNTNSLRDKIYELQHSNDLRLVISRFDNAKTLLLMAGIMDRILVNGFDWVNRDIVISLYCYFYVSILNSLTKFSFQNTEDIRFMVTLYYYTMLKRIRADEIKVDDLIGYMSKMSHGLRIPTESIKNLIALFQQAQVNITDEDYVTLKSLINLSFCSFDSNLVINPVTFTNSLSSLWFGPGKQDASLVFFENVPVFLSMVYSGNQSSFKETRFSKLLKGTKINVNNFLKSMLIDFPYIK